MRVRAGVQFVGVNKQLTNEIDSLSHPNPFLIKLDLFSTLQAACLLTGHEPTVIERCLNDTNFDDFHPNYSDAANLIESGIVSEQLETHGDLILSQALKVYARKKGFLIKGFNDTIIEESVQASGSPDTDHSALTLELNQYKRQFEQSQSEINSLKVRIAELEQQTSQQQNEKDELNNQNRNSDLLLIATLMTKAIEPRKNQRARTQAEILESIEVESNGITGLSKSRTEKVIAEARKLYKSLKNKEMK